jgi:hypothetical protein
VAAALVASSDFVRSNPLLFVQGLLWADNVGLFFFLIRELHLWRPAGNVDPLSQTSKLKNFRKVRNFQFKPTNTSNVTQLDESEPIGAQIPTQLVNPIGDETKLTTIPLTRLSWNQMPERL